MTPRAESGAPRLTRHEGQRPSGTTTLALGVTSAALALLAGTIASRVARRRGARRRVLVIAPLVALIAAATASILARRMC